MPLLATLAALYALSSCKKDKETGVPETVYTTLAELAAQSRASSAEFDINIRDLTVTAVYGNYAQLEDGTAGAQVNEAGHSLAAGQKFDGNITGRARISSGSLVLTRLETSKATMTVSDSIPCTTVTLPEIVADKAKWINRRVSLENVTFVNGFSGEAGGAGTFSQKGVQMSATCRPEGLVIADGAQGDLICYPSSSAVYVFETGDFSEHEYNSPFTAVSAFGIYGFDGENPKARLAYRQGLDQYAYGTGASEREFRLQNYSEEWVVTIRLPIRVKTGMELSLELSSTGATVSDTEAKVFVEKMSGDTLWLMDYAANTGYVVKTDLIQ